MALYLYIGRTSICLKKDETIKYWHKEEVVVVVVIIEEEE